MPPAAGRRYDEAHGGIVFWNEAIHIAIRVWRRLVLNLKVTPLDSWMLNQSKLAVVAEPLAAVWPHRPCFLENGRAPISAKR